MSEANLMTSRASTKKMRHTVVALEMMTIERKDDDRIQEKKARVE